MRRNAGGTGGDSRDPVNAAVTIARTGLSKCQAGCAHRFPCDRESELARHRVWRLDPLTAHSVAVVAGYSCCVWCCSVGGIGKGYTAPDTNANFCPGRGRVLACLSMALSDGGERRFGW